MTEHKPCQDAECNICRGDTHTIGPNPDTLSTDDIRRQMIADKVPELDLAVNEGRRWTTEQMKAEFEVIGFAAPFVVVKRRSDGATGSLEFTHNPRVYFGFVADSE